MKTKIVFSKKCLEYGKFHIESRERVKVAKEILQNKGYQFLEPKPASKSQLILVHSPSYIEKLRNGQIDDSDTPAYKDIFKYASLSAGGAILAAKIGGFSLMRPPGHHAGKEGRALGALTQGFCYLNNISIAIKYLERPSLILDIDGHHGNGTEEVFFEDRNVFYISLHRYPYYPGTGFESRKNFFNFPLKAECGHEAYLKTLKEGLKKIEIKKIEVVAVSAGFDALKGDLASLGLSEKTFFEIGKLLASLKKHTFFVLEGGYDGEALAQSIDALLRGYEGFQSIV